MATVPLPTSRNMSHPSGTVIKGTTLDDLQDCIVGQKHGDKVRRINLGAVGIDPGATGARSEDYYAPGTSTVWAPIALDAGDRLKSITLHRRGNAAADMDVRLRKTTAGGVGSYIFNVTDTNPAAAWAARTITTGLPLTVGAGESFSLLIYPNASGILIGTIEITTDRL